MTNYRATLFALLIGTTVHAASAPRITVSLDGTWKLADSLTAEQIPASFDHHGPVPGMANLATPPFPDVDRFDSREYLANQVHHKLLPESTVTDVPIGIPRQNRTFFWYQRTFRVQGRKQVAMLKINKAQFGTAVWLNGKKIGEHTACFTAGYFDLSNAINWQGENTLLVRIGAHPAALPPTIACGTDQEKSKWTPGIYDSVSLMLSDNPVIQQIQVAPRLDTSEIVVQTVLKNHAATPITTTLRQRVSGTGKSQADAASGAPQKLTLAPGEREDHYAEHPHPQSHSLDSGESVSLRAGQQHGRRQFHHSFRHARVAFRHRDTARLVEWQSLFHARLQHHASPLLRGS